MTSPPSPFGQARHSGHGIVALILSNGMGCAYTSGHGICCTLRYLGRVTLFTACCYVLGGQLASQVMVQPTA